MQPDTPNQPTPTPTEPTLSTDRPADRPDPNEVPRENPGKTLAIVGFVLAFVGMQLVGLILSIVALVKSKKAGMKNGLAIAGIVLNAVFMVIGALVIITLIAYGSIGMRANATMARSAAITAVTEATAYATENRGVYPTSSADLTSSAVNYQSEPLTTEPADPTSIALYGCGGEGNAVEYWDYTTAQPAFEFTDDSLTLADCEFIAE